MSQAGKTKSQSAEDRTKETRSFVRRVESIARWRYTAEKKIDIWLRRYSSELTGGMSVQVRGKSLIRTSLADEGIHGGGAAAVQIA